jgi:hypothetical protein
MNGLSNKSADPRECLSDSSQEIPPEPLYFRLGDYVAGAVTGVLTALAVRLIVGPQWDMVVAMLVGMGVGMLVHMTLLLLFIPLLGTFEVMMPGAVIGMFGGMLFGMRDSMQQAYVPMSTALEVGALFGFLVVIGIRWWDWQLKGGVLVNPEVRGDN